MKRIPLVKRDFCVIVDDGDYDELARYIWYAIDTREKRTAYASRVLFKPDGSKTSMLMHRMILGAEKGTFVDHRDGNGLNNRRENLRMANKSLNAANKPKGDYPITRSSSRYKGVTFSQRDQKWSAYIQVNSKRISLGFCGSEDDCAMAYNRAALHYFGEYAWLNDIEIDD